jgi:hypothetical protein
MRIPNCAPLWGRERTDALEFALERSEMQNVERKWMIATALPGATPDDWLTGIQMSGPPVRPGEAVEVVPVSQLEGAVSESETLKRALDFAEQRANDAEAEVARLRAAVAAALNGPGGSRPRASRT